MKTIIVDGVTRFYAEEGSGPAVILVHGSLSSHRQWRSLTDRLRDRFRVIAIDLLACESEGAAAKLGAFSFAQDCAFVGRLIEDNPGACLVGHSYGGVVAIKAALAHRDRLASLVLIEPSCFHLLEQERAPEYAEVIRLRDQQQQKAGQGDFAGAARGFIEYWLGPRAWTAMPERRRQLMALGIPKLDQDWPGTLDHNTRLADYRALSLRTLLVRAKDTRAPSFRIVDLIRGVLPNASLAEIENGGHMSPLTNPEPVNDAIERFVQRS